MPLFISGLMSVMCPCRGEPPRALAYEQAVADQAEPRSTGAGLAEEYGRTN